ncbi:MAG: hypothetical protein D6680_04340 [Cyanobacteria bacterium J007]|nr:MAG: hypothetical protein D6680_04340 [Cyanobacteria bacterium J007]
MTEPIIYAPEIRLFTYHLKILKTTNLTEPDCDINLRAMIAYYLRVLADYRLLDSLIKKLHRDILSPLSILESWLPNIEKIQVLVWWCKQRITILKLLIDLNLSSLTLENVINDYLFRSDFEKLTTANSPFFQIIKNPGKIGIQRVNFNSPSKYRGFFYPQYINDSYSFLLHVFHPQKLGEDGVNFSDIAELKPPESFFTGTSSNLDEPLQTHLKQASWGTTILFSGFIYSPPATLEAGKKLANQLLQELLKIDSLETAPPFLASREFLGGFLYEYQDVYNRHPYGQILILLLFLEESKEKLNAVQWSLPELFCYERKICQNYLDSRGEYTKANREIETIEKTIREFPPNIATNVLPHLSEEDLKSLQRKIKNLLDLSLRYSQIMRSLVTFENTIEINRQNYLDTLTQMEVKTQSDLGCLRDKANYIFDKFQGQIKVDLVYLQQGERLLDTAINTIRGLAELDQAERDRILENQISIIGVGIAAGAIVASSFGLVTQPWYFPNREKIELPFLSPHPLIMALIFSGLCSVGSWLIARKVIEQKRGK